MADADTNGNSKFVDLLHAQVKNEFNAHQQYVALAAWFDAEDLPRLAKHFYRQALEERNHAMMFVQYLLDQGIKVGIPGADSVRNDFGSARELLDLALQQEKDVTADIVRLAKTARDEGDYIGEQFVQWFLKEQVEEVAQMTTLVNIAARASDNLFDVENFIARESIGNGGADSGAPRAAGGSV
jgi:ferritin